MSKGKQCCPAFGKLLKSWEVFIPEAARAQEQCWARAILILDSFWLGDQTDRRSFPVAPFLCTAACTQSGCAYSGGKTGFREERTSVRLSVSTLRLVDETSVERQLASTTTLAVVESLRVWSRLGEL